MISQEILDSLNVEGIHQRVLREAGSILNLKTIFECDGDVVKFMDMERNLQVDFNKGHFNFNTLASSTLAIDKVRLHERLANVYIPSVSPLDTYDVAYRVTVLDGRAIMGYGLSTDVSCGETVVDIPVGLFTTMGAFAVVSAQALGLRVADVVMAIGKGRKLKIIDVHSSVSLERVACVSPKYYGKSLEAYVMLIASALEKQKVEIGM